MKSQDSAVGIVTGPWAMLLGWGVESWRMQMGKVVSSPKRPRSGAQPASYSTVPELLPGWCTGQSVKLTTHILLSSEVQKKWSYSFIPAVYVRGGDRDKLSF